MNSCPHCNKEIQDEAVFCRFCRRDIDPPLWLTSLQKCTFCAEWVERGIDRCPLCGKELSTEQVFSVDTEGSEHSESLLARLKPSLEESPEIAEEEALVDNEVVGEEVFSTSPQEEVRLPRIPVESEEGLAILYERRLDQDKEFDSLKDLRSSSDQAIPEPDIDKPTTSRATYVRWALLLGGIIAIALVVIFALRSLDLSSLTALRERTPDPTSTQSIAPTAAATATQPVAGVLPPVNTTTPGSGELGCIRWDEVSLDSEGETLCVFGVLKRWFQSGEIPYVAIFSEAMGTFEIIDYTRTYPEFKAGTCIMVEGEIMSMRTVRPYIDADGTLSLCKSGLE